MNVVKKIYPPTDIPTSLTGITNLAIVTEFAVGEGEKDKVKLNGGAIVCEYEKIRNIYTSTGKIILVIDGDTKMKITKYDEEGKSLPKSDMSKNGK